MGILDSQKIITGIKLKPENRPDLPQFALDKTKPLGPYNFPVMKYAVYVIHGYKTDSAGIRRPVSWTENLPIGKRIRFAKDKYPGITITSCKRSVVM